MKFAQNHSTVKVSKFCHLKTRISVAVVYFRYSKLFLFYNHYYRSPLCKKTPFINIFLCLETYDDHMKEHCENEWLCHLCGRKLKTKRNLINHYYVHSGEKPFNCDECGKVFTCKDKLKLHYKIHQGIRPHVCLICNKAFIQKGHLASHSKSHVSWNIY